MFAATSWVLDKTECLILHAANIQYAGLLVDPMQNNLAI
jgi:hypothetical protein